MSAENTEFKQVDRSQRTRKRKSEATTDRSAISNHSQMHSVASSQKRSEHIRDDIVLPTKVKSTPMENIIGLGTSPPVSRPVAPQENSKPAVESMFSPDSGKSARLVIIEIKF